MIGKVNCAGLYGIEGYPVQVEADLSSGLPSFEMVGFLGSEVREARERVKSALRNSGFTIPTARLTINLSPANKKKAGNHFDLAIAVAILVSSGLKPNLPLSDYLFAGELGLDGSLKPIKGTISLAITASQMGYKGCILPAANAPEGACLQQIQIYSFSNLKEVMAFLHSPGEYSPYVSKENKADRASSIKEDFSELIGQPMALRAAEIAAAGMHNLLLSGPPGTGKSMLAKRIPSILPDLSLSEQLELTKIYSIQGLTKEGLVTERPFRNPHHTISPHGMSGGGGMPRPGEISLAHCGVLFLDEMPEFRRETLEVLRQPLEDGFVAISRNNGIYRFPAKFMLVGAMNPCKCGYYPDRNRCHCSEASVYQYQSRISKPLLDRIDMTVEMKSMTLEQIDSSSHGTSSKIIKDRVMVAFQRQRFRSKEASRFNSALTGTELMKAASLGAEEKSFLRSLYGMDSSSLRSYHKLLRIARTIADLDDREKIRTEDLSEAWFFRNALGLSPKEERH